MKPPINRRKEILRWYKNYESLGNNGGASGDNWLVLNVESTESDVRQVNDLLLP
jgi:hypothetical protein